MKNLAPNITRKRLLIEGYYFKQMDESAIKTYFETITTALSLRTYGDPIIFSTKGAGKEDHQGYDAFVPLIDSGISLYVWTEAQFFSLIIYTCKDFDEQIAMTTTMDFFQSTSVETMTF